ncbi:unnamed protein product [Trichogramma brassicae]|uniref:Uncharacterized protein n=1 Tax=Trichogramma brassicae TaxID=86971 RepID=A0A6H5J0B8_9HYME|nr:unnamed protein product [Trichogramma brassicae]
MYRGKRRGRARETFDERRVAYYEYIEAIFVNRPIVIDYIMDRHCTDEMKGQLLQLLDQATNVLIVRPIHVNVKISGYDHIVVERQKTVKHLEKLLRVAAYVIEKQGHRAQSMKSTGKRWHECAPCQSNEAKMMHMIKCLLSDAQGEIVACAGSRTHVALSIGKIVDALKRPSLASGSSKICDTGSRRKRGAAARNVSRATADGNRTTHATVAGACDGAATSLGAVVGARRFTFHSRMRRTCSKSSSSSRAVSTR